MHHHAPAASTRPRQPEHGGDLLRTALTERLGSQTAEPGISCQADEAGLTGRNRSSNRLHNGRCRRIDAAINRITVVWRHSCNDNSRAPEARSLSQPQPPGSTFCQKVNAIGLPLRRLNHSRAAVTGGKNDLAPVRGIPGGVADTSNLLLIHCAPVTC